MGWGGTGIPKCVRAKSAKKGAVFRKWKIGLGGLCPNTFIC